MAGQIPSNFGIRKPTAWRWVTLASLLIMAVLSSLWLASRLRRPAQPALRFWSVSFSPDGASVVTGGGGTRATPPHPGELFFWNVGSGRKRAVSQRASVRSVAWSPNGEFVAVGDLGGVAKMVSPKSGQTLLSFSPPASAVNAVATSGDGKLVAGATFDGTVDLWDNTGKEQHLFIVQQEKFLDVAISPNNASMVATGKSGKAYLFDLAQPGDPVKLQAYRGPPKHEPTAECAAFSPDSLTVATGSLTTLRLWEIRAGALQQDLSCSANVNNIAFDPAGETVATVHADGQLALWDVRTGEQVKSTQAHPDEAFGLAYSPNGKQIATVSRNDFTIKIWDADTLQLVASLHRSNSQ